MSKSFKVAVSSCLMPPDEGRVVFSKKSLSYMEHDMSLYLSEHGCMPLMVPIPLQGDLLDEFLEDVDGLLLQGGTDVSPLSYGAEPIEEGRWPGDYERDQYELALLKKFWPSQKPIFAICRGMQVLNVFLGGSLYQDLQTQRLGCSTHRDAELYDLLHHPVQWVRGRLLEDLYGAGDTPLINSVHHQGIETLGQGLRVDALSTGDEIIEAVIGENMKEHFVLGVQWHPEFSPTLGDIILSPSPLMEAFKEGMKRCKSKSK